MPFIRTPVIKGIDLKLKPCREKAAAVRTVFIWHLLI